MPITGEAPRIDGVDVGDWDDSLDVGFSPAVELLAEEESDQLVFGRVEAEARRSGGAHGRSWGRSSGLGRIRDGGSGRGYIQGTFQIDAWNLRSDFMAMTWSSSIWNVSIRFGSNSIWLSSVSIRFGLIFYWSKIKHNLNNKNLFIFKF